MDTPETDALTLAMVGKGDAEHLLALDALSCRLERERDKAKSYKRVLKDENKKLRIERDKARQEAQDFRDGMGAHLTEGPAEFSWEATKL